MLRALSFFFTSLILVAQGTQPSSADSFATTDDGSQLYFISGLMLRGSTDETPAAKLFKYVARTYSLVTQIPAGSGWYMLAPRLSGDGTVAGYVASQDCGNSCNLSPGQGYQTVLQFPRLAAPVTLPYYCQISRNAQYALCVTAQPLLQQVAIVNLSTMQMSSPQSTVCHGRNLITSDGHALAWDQHHVSLFAASGAQQLSISVESCPAISDDGSTIVYVSNQKLFAYNVASGNSALLNGELWRSDAIDGVSNDGTVILQSGLMYRTTDSAVIPLGVDLGAGLVTPNLLAGGGVYAWAGFAQFDSAGEVLDATDPTPVYYVTGQSAPGSQIVVQGRNLTNSVAHALTFPGPITLAGVEVKLNGIPVPLISVSPTSVNFQLPWEVTAATLEVDTNTASKFVQGSSYLFLAPLVPRLVSGAINANFSAEIGQSNPANPGDVVNFYLTGLGPVSPSAADGVPAPSNPLSVITTAITVSYQSQPLKIYYAGLAPGLIGIYQLTVQTPAKVQQVLDGSGPVQTTLTLQFSSPNLINAVSLPVWIAPNP
jgi:uncharacterized protein (TIGR03437 family)